MEWMHVVVVYQPAITLDGVTAGSCFATRVVLAPTATADAAFHFPTFGLRVSIALPFALFRTFSLPFSRPVPF
eukprot:m.239062 g.239062  ORF g.239062 m.239062 type:complete len:73 (+) comp15815_c0_seq6:85-303(+)